MFRHVALFRFTPESTPDQHEAVLDVAAGAAGACIPEIRDYQVGLDLGLVEGNWQAVVVADFDDEDGWRTYTDDPSTSSIIAEQIRPILAERAAVQYEL